jgi:hypothetical protein
VKYSEVSKFVGNQREKIASRKKLPSLAGSNHVFASGENARHSGIYKIEHHSEQVHQVEKEVFIAGGTKLPFCPLCASPLKFRLMQTVQYITEDPDFQ